MTTKKPKITAKQEGGDDGHCYAIRVDGVLFCSGLTRSEVPYHKAQALKMWEAKQAKATEATVDAKVLEIAQQLVGFLGDACSEVAYESTKAGSGFLDDDMTKRIRKAKKDKVQDIPGWLADELYNDADFLEGMAGDRLYDLCNGDRKLYQTVANYMASGNHYHAALRTAALGLIG